MPWLVGRLLGRRCRGRVCMDRNCGCCAAGDALTKHVSPSRGKIMAAQLSVATTFPFTILLLKVTASLLCCGGVPAAVPAATCLSTGPPAPGW